MESQPQNPEFRNNPENFQPSKDSKQCTSKSDISLSFLPEETLDL